MDSLQLILDDWKLRGDSICLSAAASDPDGLEHRLVYEIPLVHADSLVQFADPFVIGFLFAFMQWGKPVQIRAKVSASLLDKLELYMSIWNMWMPDRFQPVELTADEESEIPAAGRGRSAVMLFDGGIDAAFTAWRHHRMNPGRRQQDIQAGICCAALNSPAPSEQPDIFTHEKRMLSSIGMECIPVKSNISQLPWAGPLTHSVAEISLLTLFAGRFSTGVVANHNPYSALRVMAGSCPVVDPLLSSEGFEVVDDGGEFTPQQKAAALKPWPEAARISGGWGAVSAKVARALLHLSCTVRANRRAVGVE